MAYRRLSDPSSYPLRDLSLPKTIQPTNPSSDSGKRSPMFSMPKGGGGGYGFRGKPMDPKRRRRLIISYIPDWIISIGLAAVFLGLEKVHGFRRDFSLEDTSLRHPFATHERVPPLALYMICLVAPVVLQPIINLLTIRSWWDLHQSWLGLVLSLCLTGAVTQITKITVGRPRPDVISRCIPMPGSVDPQWALSNSSICTQTDDHILNDGFRSFPSGHSSLSFAGLGFLSFYIAGKLHLFDKKGHAPKAWIALTPLAGAIMVAVSRTMDYRHHWQDVTTGSILGLFFSYFAYRQYYPSLASEKSHRPYSPRIAADPVDTIIPMHGGPSGLNAPAGRYDDPLMPYGNNRHSTESTDGADGLAHAVPNPERKNMKAVWRDEEEVNLQGPR